MEQLKRCRICQLPHTYPGLTISEDGVCNLCSREKKEEAPYRGMDALRNRVAKVLAQPEYTGRPYDAAVAFSGGRDSTYLVNFAKNVLGLKVLAVTLQHDFMPVETENTIRQICKDLGVDLHLIPNAALNQCSTQSVQAWAREPEAATLVSFCTGCRYGIKRLIPDYCKQVGIPLLLVGNTRMEQMSYRQDLMALDPSHPTALNKMTGYLGAILRNPAMLGGVKSIGVQAYEFAYPFARKLIKDRKLTVLAPFRDYTFVSDEERTASLNALGWKHNEGFKSEWRADCYVNILRQYFYRKLLGFNDMDVQYADLLRGGQITLEEAQAKLAEESQIDEGMIREILKKYYDLELDEILAKCPKLG